MIMIMSIKCLAFIHLMRPDLVPRKITHTTNKYAYVSYYGWEYIFVSFKLLKVTTFKHLKKRNWMQEALPANKGLMN